MRRGFWNSQSGSRMESTDASSSSQAEGKKPFDPTRVSSEKVKTKLLEKEEASRSDDCCKYITTDQGSKILIGDFLKSPLTSQEKKEFEAEFIQKFQNHNLYVKQLSGYDESFNCHGYTLADGKANRIYDCDAKKIVNENGFKEIATANNDTSDYTYTAKPQVGDIILYKDENHRLLHSGVISKFAKNPKEILVTSKLGNLGIFEHSITFPHIPDPDPEYDCKPTYWEIYHTNRPQGRLITEISNNDRK